MTLRVSLILLSFLFYVQQVNSVQCSYKGEFGNTFYTFCPGPSNSRDEKFCCGTETNVVCCDTLGKIIENDEKKQRENAALAAEGAKNKTVDDRVFKGANSSLMIGFVIFIIILTIVILFCCWLVNILSISKRIDKPIVSSRSASSRENLPSTQRGYTSLQTEHSNSSRSSVDYGRKGSAESNNATSEYPSTHIGFKMRPNSNPNISGPLNPMKPNAPSFKYSSQYSSQSDSVGFETELSSFSKSGDYLGGYSGQNSALNPVGLSNKSDYQPPPYSSYNR